MARIRNTILVVVVVVLGTAVTASAICNECETLYEDCLQKAKSIEKVYCDIQRLFCGAFICPVDELKVHDPAFDDDGDHYSDIQHWGARGHAWRGADCDDQNADHHPGRMAAPTSDDSVDWNCNGIYGGNATGSYEDIFCSGTEQMGVIMIGDSTTAHFSLPLSGPGVLDEYPALIDSELDKPPCSWGTGYYDNPLDCSNRDPLANVSSIYKFMLDRNRCVFRDMQNIAVNGMRSNVINTGLIKSLARNQTVDHPALVIYSEVANDVCNPHCSPGCPGDPANNTKSHMTSVADYRTNVETTLAYLDTILPAGSHVVFTGYLKGEMYYDLMHTEPWPLFGMNYQQAWNWVSDLVIDPKGDCRSGNPCCGWLNDDAELRAFTTNRSLEYVQVYKDIIAQTPSPYKNFDMHYVELPDGDILQEWADEGKDYTLLVQQVGGVHPSTAGSTLWAQAVWKSIEALGILPPVNPHNQEIIDMFGDQGGYGDSGVY